MNKKDNKKDKSQRKLVNLTFHDQLVLDWPQILHGILTTLPL